VLLADKATQVQIVSKSGFQVVDGSGAKHAMEAGTYAVGAGFKVTNPAAPQAKAQALGYPLEFRAAGAALILNGRTYRGSLQILKLDKGRVRVVNLVGLDFYLRGVVPSEMPKDWAPEALKAQAVAARSYAVSHLHPAGGFDL
jgi:peptidoglycan hydrolase-like amidase